MARASAIVLLLVLVSAAKPQAAGRRLDLVFTQRSPNSALGNVLGRMDINLDKLLKPTDADAQRAIWQYDISQQHFDVIVPPGYTRDTPHGLLVWLGNVDVPGAWLDALAKQKLILVAPVNAKERVMPVAAGLALDAAFNMTKRYTISPQRIYVGGFSSGAQRASWIIRAFPDVFRGAYLMMGGWFYQVESSYDGWFFDDTHNFVHFASYVQPLDPQWKGQYEKLKGQISIVIMRGERDDFFKKPIEWEREQFEGLRLDGFRRAHYIEIPGGGHAPPDAVFFEKGIVALDAPPNAPPTTGPTKGAAAHPDQVAQALRIITTAQHGQNIRALCERILKDYPNTPSADLAKRGIEYVDKEEKKSHR